MRKSEEEFFTAINIWIGREREKKSFYDAILSWEKFSLKELASESKAASSETSIDSMPAGGATCNRLLFLCYFRKNLPQFIELSAHWKHARSLETKINFPNSMSIYQNKTFSLSETNEVLNFNVFRIKRNICFVSRGMNFLFSGRMKKEERKKVVRHDAFPDISLSLISDWITTLSEPHSAHRTNLNMTQWSQTRRWLNVDRLLIN